MTDPANHISNVATVCVVDEVHTVNRQLASTVGGGNEKAKANNNGTSCRNRWITDIRLMKASQERGMRVGWLGEAGEAGSSMGRCGVEI